MINKVIGYMRCPQCAASRLSRDAAGVNCPDCGTSYPFREGILDMAGSAFAEIITPFQLVMQTPAVVSIYERLWRRLGYFLASSRSFDREVETVLRLQSGGEDSRLLDLACGTGIFTRPLARRLRSTTVVGFDLSFPMLRHARRLADQEGLDNVVLIRGTAFRLPFISAAFHGINCCGALHLFAHPDLALREIERALKPDGTLSIQTTIRPTHSAGIAYFLERFIRFGFFNEDELRERIRRQGLKILESECHRISFTLLAKHIS